MFAPSITGRVRVQAQRTHVRPRPAHRRSSITRLRWATAREADHPSRVRCSSEAGCTSPMEAPVKFCLAFRKFGTADFLVLFNMEPNQRFIETTRSFFRRRRWGKIFTHGPGILSHESTTAVSGAPCGRATRARVPHRSPAFAALRRGRPIT